MRAAWILLPLLSVFAIAAPVAGQEAAPVEPATPQQAAPDPQVLAIQPSEIANQAQRLADLLRGADATLSLDRVSVAVERQLPAIVTRVERLRAQNLAGDPSATLSQLQDVLGNWASVRRQLAGWSDDMTAQLKAIDSFADRLSRHALRWEATRTPATEQNLPQLSLDQISATIESIRLEERKLQQARDRLLTQQGVVAEQLAVAQETSTEVDARIRDIRRNLFAADRPPLWRESVKDGEFSRMGDHFVSTVVARRTQLGNFARDHEPRLVFHGVMLMLLVTTFVVLRHKSRQWPDEGPRIEATRTVLSKPISSSVLIAALLVPLLYPDAPLAARNIIGILVLIPALRIGLGLLPTVLRPILVVLVPIYLLNRFVEAANDYSMSMRFVLLAESVLVCALIYWLTRPTGRIGSFAGDGWTRAVNRAMQVAGLLLVGASIANVIGYVRLASLVTPAVIRSLFLLVMFFAVDRVGDGLIWALFRTQAARSFPAIRNHRDLIFRRSSTGGRWVLLALFVYIVLGFFKIREPIGDALVRLLGASFSIGSARFSVGGLLAFALTVWLTLVLARLVRFLLEEDLFPRMNLPRGVPQTISRLTNYAILTLGFLVAISAAGFGLDNLVLLTGALGVGIGFGLQNVVNNFVSGLVLLFERPIKVGDVIEVGELTGTVRKIGMRASSVRTFDGAEVIVPNGNLISAEVINWTLSDRLRRVQVEVGVAYGSDPAKVLELLNEAASDHENVLDDPAPSAIFKGFGESSLDFSLRAWTADFENFVRVRSDVTVAVNQALVDAGMTIPFPQRDLHLKTDGGKTSGLSSGGEPTDDARSGS